MGERRGTKALELWCRRITEGYPGVKIENMTTSWRDGLAFCAMIHHFKPELIEFEKLNKNDIYYNNDLAFRTAETHLGIPALLDADDMATYEVPDRLSILTYLSQFYQVFAAQDSTNRLKRSSTSAEKSSITKTPGPPPKMAHIVGVPKREPCRKCSLPVFLAERVNVGKNIYHRTCLKCARCKSQLSLGSFYETEIDGEFCCETCPDEESNIDDSTNSPTATTSHSEENVSPNRSVGVRNSIADRLAFFEKSGKDNQLLQKSVTDEEKSKSLKKIAEQYKPNAALTNFMNSTLGDSIGAASDENIDKEEISTEENSKCDTTVESSDEENESNFKDRPPQLPKDGPPVDYDNDDDVLSVVVESHSTSNNNAIIDQNEQKINNDNAPNFISNTQVLLTSPCNKIINATQNHHNHYHNIANNNNIYNNDLNLSSKITKDISNIQNDDVQTRTTNNTKSAFNITPDTDESISLNVELRNKEEPLKATSKLNSFQSDSNMKIDLTEQRLSVVRSRLQQFEEVLKSEEDMNNCRKSTISISSSNKLNIVGNSKLVDKSVTKITEGKDENTMLNLTGNEVPNENTIITKESNKIQRESSSDDLKHNKIEEMEVDSKHEDSITLNKIENQNDLQNIDGNGVLEEEISAETKPAVMEKEIEEQIKLSEDDKQAAVINGKESNEIVLTLHTSAETNLKNENDENIAVEISEESQISANTQGDNNTYIPPKISLDKNIKNNLKHMAVDISQKNEEKKRNTSINRETCDNNEIMKSAVNQEENEYPDELNPFASDDDDENDTKTKQKTDDGSMHKNIIQKEAINNKFEEPDRRKSLNPFDNSDDDENLEQVEQNQDIKLKPPRPPPPKISKNPFGSESEEENEALIDSGNTSLVSMESGKRAPVPTPRSQLTPTNKRNLTPEPTPRSARQSFSTDTRLGNSSEYYGSSASLNTSLTSPNGKDHFYRHHDTRSSNNSLASSAGGSSGVNTIKSRKKKAPAPPPPATLTSVIPKASKELFSPNELESKKSTPASSTSTTPQMARKKRPAPKPPTGLVTSKKDEIQLTENVPQSSNLCSPSETETSSGIKNNFANNSEEVVNKSEIDKLSDEEKVAHLDGRQFFLEATSTSNKVPEIYQKEDKTLKEVSLITEATQQGESSIENNVQKTGGVECIEIKGNNTIFTQINQTSNIEGSQISMQEDSCITNPTSIELSHDRHIEKIKDNKESKNRNRQSQHYNEDIHTDPLFNKSVHGKWKRRKGPAPSLPVPPRKVLQMLPLQEIRHELEIIEVQQQGLEKQGVILETMIRERCEGKNGELINQSGTLDEKQPNSKEVEDLILQLFELVNEKNELFRRQAELMYLRRQHRLEQEQADLEYEIRVLMAQPERNKTDSDKAREEALIARLVEVVQLRNEVIECLEMDRLREAEEDLSIKQRLEMHAAKRDEELCKQTPTKLSKKEKKKQKESKKLGKSKKIDADKDADETEINLEAQKKKKKRKFIFSVLTSSKTE